MNISKTIKDHLFNQKLCVLATTDDGKPYTNLVAFAMTEDLSKIIYATPKNTRKYKNLLKKAEVSILIDNRTNSEADFDNAYAVTALGNAYELNESEKNEFLAVFIRKHPYLLEFSESEKTAFFVVDVRTYRLVGKFQDVIELSFPQS
jgi:nitroimidazol reductase NimA-like FMN-containing flavoprotein (pyridoxamine 5'-phosphate oxidase superfamily)